jgi:hypothetical protein
MRPWEDPVCIEALAVSDSRPHPNPSYTDAMGRVLELQATGIPPTSKNQHFQLRTIPHSIDKLMQVEITKEPDFEPSHPNEALKRGVTL